MNTLYWIKNEENWGAFVMNRVREIRAYSDPENWKYVPGDLNPADIPSRGCSAKSLKFNKWHEGPKWLKLDKTHWPSYDIAPEREEVDKEKKKLVVSSLLSLDEEFPYLSRISSFEKIIRTTAWMKRFMNNCRLEKKERVMSSLKIEEIKEAEIIVWKIVQRSSFKLEKDERLRHLKPFVDSSGLIRMKSRILMREDSEDFRMPIILPSDHPVVTKLITEKHKHLLHSGVQTLMSILRENFWILKARKTIRKIVRNCVKCKRFETKPLDIESPPLPEDRIKDSAVFEVVGIDLAGPLFLKNGSKSWIVLFTCAVYRAVHLELVTSLSTENFLLAFRRFIARRGRIRIVYTDNGTNFVGASALLKNIDWEKVIAKNSINRITWKFIPPASPWWGGFWERLIGLMKRILRKVLGNASLEYEEVITILCDCENIINSRPITYLSEDIELEPLTPAMFLRGIQKGDVPDLDNIDSNYLQKRYKYRVKLREDLRKRFRTEYLGQLKNCTRKVKESSKLSIGDIVMIETSDKRINWPLAKVIELFPGKDGLVRLVNLRTQYGELLRPIQRLYPLEINTHPDDFLREKIKSTVPAVELSPDKISGKNNSPPDKLCASDALITDNSKVSRFGRVVRTPERLDLLNLSSTVVEFQPGETQRGEYVADSCIPQPPYDVID